MRNRRVGTKPLVDVAERVESRRRQLVSAMVQKGLRTVSLADDEVDTACARLCALARADGELADRRPVGTVAIMLPGNTALAAPLGLIGAATLAGNRVRLRFPRRTAWLRDLLEELIAPVREAVSFADAPGPEFLHQQLATGGADVVMTYGEDRWAGRYEDRVRRSRAKFLFEGPGKDPFLVLGDADVERAASAAVRGAFYNGGQACVAVERAYVLEPLLGEFLERVLSRVQALSVGPNEVAETDIGPFTNTAVVERFVVQVADAIDRGARLVWPRAFEHVASPASDGGIYLSPVVLTNVHHGMKIMREETFGPALPICGVESVDQAVALAEDSRYGLAASVFGAAPDVTARLRASHGVVTENELVWELFARHPLAPFGGYKQSSWVWEWDGPHFIRREGPRRSLLEFSTPVRGLRSQRS